MALERSGSSGSVCGVCASVCGGAEKEDAAAAVGFGRVRLRCGSAAAPVDKKYLPISRSPAAASGQDLSRLVKATVVCYECLRVSA